MKGSTYKRPRGFRDINPHNTEKMRQLYNIFVDICKGFNCHEIKLPLLEYTGLFQRSLGIMSDVVSKEMYTFNNLSLRPEITAQTARFAIENNITGNFCYFGECFRHERPQSNRYRQFYTVGVEFMGSKHTILNDCMVLELMDTFFKTIGIDYSIYVNNIGSSHHRAKYIDHIEGILREHKHVLSDYALEKIKNNNILRVLDSKEPQDQEIIKNLPTIMSFVGEESTHKFSQITQFLDKNNYNWQIKHSLVRGLDYYNDLVFECVLKHQESTKRLAICGGGRYDGLFEQLGGIHTPSVGFGIGVDRILPHAKVFTAHRPKILVNFMEHHYDNNINKLRGKYVVECTSCTMKNMFKKYGGKDNDGNFKYDYFLVLGTEWTNHKKIIIINANTTQQLIYSVQDTLEFFNGK